MTVKLLLMCTGGRGQVVSRVTVLSPAVSPLSLALSHSSISSKNCDITVVSAGQVCSAKRNESQHESVCKRQCVKYGER